MEELIRTVDGEPGDFILMAGKSSRQEDLLQTVFTLE